MLTVGFDKGVALRLILALSPFLDSYSDSIEMIILMICVPLLLAVPLQRVKVRDRIFVFVLIIVRWNNTAKVAVSVHNLMLLNYGNYMKKVNFKANLLEKPY